MEENKNEIVVKNENQSVSQMQAEKTQNQDIITQRVAYNNAFDMQPLLLTAGTLHLTKEQEKILRAPVLENEIQIRPDGLVYLPWSFYQDRLDKAFGASWSLVPNGMPKVYGNYVVWGFYLIIQGRFVDFSIGQQEYIPQNRNMTYGDAIEGAKSNALMRCCKRLGIGLELWNSDFVENWKRKYAIQVTENGKKIWKKKNNQEQKIEQNTETKSEEQKQEEKKQTEMNYSIIQGVNIYNPLDFEIKPIRSKSGREGIKVKIAGMPKGAPDTLYCFDSAIIDKINHAKQNSTYEIRYVEKKGYNHIIDIVEEKEEK